MTKISVIIPVYNTESYLRKCLDSIVNQTLKDIEIICINDCSTDSSRDILKEYEQKDNRIRIIDFEKNKGVSVARNSGINVATGEYIGFVDSDDFIDLDFYEKLYDKAIETNSDIVKGNLKYIENNQELKDFQNLNDKIRENKFNFNCNFSTAIYRTDLIKSNHINFLEDVSWSEDRLFQVMALLHANNINVIDDTFYYYISHKNSLTTGENCLYQKNRDRIRVLTILLRELNDFNLSNEDYDLLFNEFFIQIIEALRNNEDTANKLYKEISELLNTVNIGKLPIYIRPVINTSQEDLYKNLIKYKNLTLIGKIRNKGDK